MSRRTILIALTQALCARRLTHEPVLSHLRASGHQLVVLAPGGDVADLQSTYRDPNIIFERLEAVTPSPLERVLHSFRRHAVLAGSDNGRPTYGPARPAGAIRRRLVRAAKWVGRRLGPNRTQRVCTWIQETFFGRSPYGPLFESYAPDLVIVTEVFDAADDYKLLLEARRQTVPTFFLPSRWDDLDRQDVLPAPIDYLAAWSDGAKAGAVDRLGFHAQRVAVTGAPRFDVYGRRTKMPDRRSFFETLGIDPDHALLTFCMAPHRHDPSPFNAVRATWHATVDGQLPGRPHILVQMHPDGPDAVPADLKENPEITVLAPQPPGALRDPVRQRDPLDLAVALKHSAVVVNLFSTTALEAALCDTPVICLAYDDEESLRATPFSRRNTPLSAARRMLATRGVSLASDEAGLIAALNAYLLQPDLRRTERAQMVRHFCGPNDGLASERTVRAILVASGAEIPADPRVETAQSVL